MDNIKNETKRLNQSIKGLFVVSNHILGSFTLNSKINIPTIFMTRTNKDADSVKDNDSD